MVYYREMDLGGKAKQETPDANRNPGSGSRNHRKLVNQTNGHQRDG
jgi:hypothetical protein